MSHGEYDGDDKAFCNTVKKAIAKVARRSRSYLTPKVLEIRVGTFEDGAVNAGGGTGVSKPVCT